VWSVGVECVECGCGVCGVWVWSVGVECEGEGHRKMEKTVCQGD